MKIVLQREVEKLGRPGDVVEVADGYARNYLIPRHLAVPATRGTVRHAENLKRAHETRVQREVREARELATRMGARPLRMPARAGDDGRLFGSITAAHLAEALSKAIAHPVDRRRIELPEPIRSLGTHEVRVHLHAEVTAAVTVDVVKQSGVASPPP